MVHGVSWECRDKTLCLCQTAVCGILNVTPDSFWKDSRTFSVESALQKAAQMEKDGAALLDIGAQSTRPGCGELSAAQEQERLLPVLIALREQTALPLSVDTLHPETARSALENGADIINDVSGTLSAEMLSAVAAYGAGLVCMHAGGGADDRQTDEALPNVRLFFEDALEKTARAGIPVSHLCLDPGVGFGKSLHGDRQLLRELPALLNGLPPTAVMVGASRKRVTDTGNIGVEQRLPATLALHTAAQLGGATVLRVHDVKEAVLAARAVDLLF